MPTIYSNAFYSIIMPKTCYEIIILIDPMSFFKWKQRSLWWTLNPISCLIHSKMLCYPRLYSEQNIYVSFAEQMEAISMKDAILIADLNWFSYDPATELNVVHILHNSTPRIQNIVKCDRAVYQVAYLATVGYVIFRCLMHPGEVHL